MKGASCKSRFRHYLNLHKTEVRFKKLLQDFSFEPIGNKVTEKVFVDPQIHADFR